MSAEDDDLAAILFQVDCANAFESFSEPELWCLSQYNELCVKVETGTFAQRKIVLSVKASPEESYERMDHAGNDALAAMMMAFRQLWTHDEAVGFHRTRELLRTHTPASGALDVVAVLDELGRRFREVNREGLMGLPPDETRARELIEDWLYSGPLHTDPERVERRQRWSRIQWDFSLIKAVNHNLAVMYDLLVAVRGALDAQSPPSAASA